MGRALERKPATGAQALPGFITIEHYKTIVTLDSVAALSSAPENVGEDTGATAKTLTMICNVQ